MGHYGVDARRKRAHIEGDARGKGTVFLQQRSAHNVDKRDGSGHYSILLIEASS